MKLCFLGDVRSIHIQKFIKYFSENHETYLISLDYRGDPRVDPGIEFFKKSGTKVYLFKKIYLPLIPFLTRYTIGKINPDIVHGHFLTHYGFLGAISGVHPIVVSAMGDDILLNPFSSLIYKFTVSSALKYSDAITCDGVNSKNVMMEKFSVREDKISLIYPGINMDLFHPSKRVESIDRVVFYPRGFDKIYDTKTLLSVIKIVHMYLPDVKFVLLGIGSEFDTFKNDITNQKLDSCVTYLGHVPNEKLPYHFASSDVSITTSLSDGGIPVSTIEAMACGTPVVSTDAGDSRLWVKDGISGYVVGKKSPYFMSSRIIDLLKDKQKRMKFGEESRKIVEVAQDYNLEMNKMEQLYLSLINN